MKTENPLLAGEYGALPGTEIELGGKKFRTVDVKSNGDIEVVRVDEEGRLDVSFVKIIRGDLQINPFASKGTGS